MSAIARFLVEFEPTPAPSHGPIATGAFPALSEALGDGDALGGLGDDFGMLSEQDAGDLERDGGFGEASSDAAPLEATSAGTSTEEALTAALATAEAQFAQRVAALEEDYARARAEDRIRWARDEGSALAEGFRRATAEIEEHIVDAVAAVLQPLVSDLARSTALRELRDAIGTLTAAGSATTIQVAGPEDLVVALRSALGAGGDTSGLSFVASQEAEVTVTADNSTIRTRLAEWSASFDGSLGGDA